MVPVRIGGYHPAGSSAAGPFVNVICEHCQKRYLIADEKVRGRSLRIRCRRCDGVITIGEEPSLEPTPAEPKAGWEDERTVAVPSLDISWTFFAMVKGQQAGPFDVADLESKIRSGEIGQRNYLWRQGMPDWKRAGELPELGRLFTAMSGSFPRTERPPRPEPPPRVAEPSPAPVPEPAPAAPRQREPVSVVADGPATGVAEPSPGLSLGELFSDADALPSERDTVDDEPVSLHASEPAHAPGEDPFAGLGDIDPSKLGPPGESTSFYIAQAGVNRRNPPWKIAAVVFGGVLVPVGVLYLLSELQIVPLQVTHVDETGKEVTESVFSAGGVSGLRDMLAGKKPQEEAPAKPKKQGVEPPVAQVKPATATGPTRDQLADLYNDPNKQTTGPRVRRGLEEKTKDTTQGGLSEEAVSKVVARSQPAFQQCIEQELRKNPGFKGGRINIVATVGSSGIVKRAEIDRRDIDLSDLGGCLKRRAKQMQFSSFSGDEETEVHIPLILSATL